MSIPFRISSDSTTSAVQPVTKFQSTTKLPFESTETFAPASVNFFSSSLLTKSIGFGDVGLGPACAIKAEASKPVVAQVKVADTAPKLKVTASLDTALPVTMVRFSEASFCTLSPKLA